MEIRKSLKTCKLSAIDPGDCFLAPWDDGETPWMRTTSEVDTSDPEPTYQCISMDDARLEDFFEDDVELVTAYITVERWK